MEKEKKKISFEELKETLEKCQKEKAEYLAGWQRSRADFLNYKKEEMKRISEILKYAGEELVLKILPILDSFNLAEKKLPERVDELRSSPRTSSLERVRKSGSSFDFANARVNDENPEGKPSASYKASIKGILQIKTQLQGFLKSQGVEEIKCLGEKFDPNFQEAVEEVEKKEVESGIVIEETQKGYTLHGKVIRPAKVKVSK